MSAFDYLRPRATAERLIKRYGQRAQLRRSTSSGPEFDPIVTLANHDCRIAILAYEEKQIDGTRIRASDKLVYMSTEKLTIEPTESDALVIGGIVHEIVTVKPLSPADVVMFYEVQARR